MASTYDLLSQIDALTDKVTALNEELEKLKAQAKEEVKVIGGYPFPIKEPKLDPDQFIFLLVQYGYGSIRYSYILIRHPRGWVITGQVGYMDWLDVVKFFRERNITCLDAKIMTFPLAEDLESMVNRQQ